MSWKVSCGEPGHTIAMTETSSCPGREDVHAWHAHVDRVFTDPAAVAHARNTLNAADRDRFDRYHVDRDRRMFVLGRWMSRQLVGQALGVPAESWEWRTGTHGRPEIAAPPTPVRFNLAHSAGLVVCALANAREVGVDVEDLERPPIDERMVRRYLSPSEADDVEAHGEDWRHRFLVYWTLKEAYLKALGLGISVPLREISFALEPEIRIMFLGSLAATSTSWAFQLLQPTERHLVAIAASADDGVRPAISIGAYAIGSAAAATSADLAKEGSP
jgi:4'-phosphopantetheinyl transferase